MSPFGVVRHAGDARLAERHQDLTLRTHFEDLMSLAIARRVFSVRSLSVSHPEVALSIDVNTVR
jgi:hypothetical protein